MAKIIQKPNVIIADSVKYFQLENTVFIFFVSIDTIILISYLLSFYFTIIVIYNKFYYSYTSLV